VKQLVNLLLLAHCKISEIVLNVTSPLNEQGLVTSGDGEGVGVFVGVGVGVYPLAVTDIERPPQIADDVGVGVGVGVGVFVGVKLGDGVTKQSNIAEKSKSTQGFVVVVVVTHIPSYATVSSKSGFILVLPYAPN
jgi:hypothetical protein